MSAPRLTDQQATELKQLNDALESAGIYVAVELRDGAIILSGEVDSSEMHEAALDLSEVVAKRLGALVEDAIDVLDIEFADDASGDDARAAESGTLTDLGTIDTEQAGEEAIPYFPPTDPVLGERAPAQTDFEVIGGFQTTSLEGDEAEAAVQPFRGDERITEDVLRELREDATTTDLSIHVHTRDGVVFLVGEVPSMDDADNAEEVAGRVSGVAEVREELKIRALRPDRER